MDSLKTHTHTRTEGNTPQNLSYSRVISQYAPGPASQLKNIASATNISSSPFMNLTNNFGGFTSQSTTQVRMDQQSNQPVQRVIEPIRIQSNYFNRVVSGGQPSQPIQPSQSSQPAQPAQIIQPTQQYTTNYENPANSRISQVSQNSWNGQEASAFIPTSNPQRGQLQRAVSSGNLLPDNIPEALQRQNSFGGGMELKRHNSLYIDPLAHEAPRQILMNHQAPVQPTVPRMFFREPAEPQSFSRPESRFRSASNPVLRPHHNQVAPESPVISSTFERQPFQQSNTFHQFGSRTSTEKTDHQPNNVLMTRLGSQSYQHLPMAPSTPANFTGYFGGRQSPQTPLMQSLGLKR